MNKLDTLIQDLVIANRILAKEDVVDAYGHISVRHPDNPKRFFISRSLAPELIEKGDIVELDLDGAPVDADEKRSLYLERFIHAAIFQLRPDVNAVVHAHAEDTLPFGIAKATKLKPVIHSGSFIGMDVPVWDIAKKFGDTNVLVTIGPYAGRFVKDTDPDLIERLRLDAARRRELELGAGELGIGDEERDRVLAHDLVAQLLHRGAPRVGPRAADPPERAERALRQLAENQQRAPRIGRRERDRVDADAILGRTRPDAHGHGQGHKK